MSKPRKWVRGAASPSKVSMSKRFPQMVGPVVEILEEMADTEGCIVSQRQMYDYLKAPEPDGLGLTPGETMAPNYHSFRNWMARENADLWALRGGKRARSG